MSLKGAAYVVGAWEHPIRKAPDMSVAQLHAECARGALEDAGLSKDDVDGYFCSGDAPGLGPINMVEYMGLKVRHVDSTDVGGSSNQVLLGHAVEAIHSGRCNVALLTLAGRPRSQPPSGAPDYAQPELMFERPYRATTPGLYGMCAARHMYEYGTTSEQLAWVKVAASHHAQHNPHAMLRNVVTVDEVLASPMVATPLHRLDCCVISDGGGAVIVARPEIARSLKRPLVKVVGVGEATKDQRAGEVEVTFSAGRNSAAAAFEMAGVAPTDIRYASIYDSFTITVIITLEDLGFCEKGQGGRFVQGGGLISGQGRLAVNTDGGGLCNNHPANRGGITKIIEAVRQARGEAHPSVQVADPGLVLAHGTGGWLGTRHGSGTVILERE
jgi:acetyl-CoA C-acetyltransferase